MDDLYHTLLLAGLTLDGGAEPLEIDRAELERFYLPLAQRVLALELSQRRAVTAVAGPPGSGKSAFTALLSATANALAGRAVTAVAGMDGWHFPNHFLDNHTTAVKGQALPLRAIKGAPQTFDVRALADFLRAARAQAELAYPVYSRETHDPLPAAGRLDAAQRILLIEGNYLLLDEPPWTELRPLFDLTIFLRAGPPALLEGLRRRHLRGGKDPRRATRHTLEVDLPNIEYVLAHSTPADVLVEKAGGHAITAFQ